MATKRAYVYKVPGLIDSYKVYPPVIVIEKNDKFELVNTVADHDAFLTIPDGVFQGPAIKKEKVDKQKPSSPKDPVADLIAGVQYEVKVDGKPAAGNSDPVIIIDAS